MNVSLAVCHSWSNPCEFVSTNSPQRNGWQLISPSSIEQFVYQMTSHNVICISLIYYRPDSSISFTIVRRSKLLEMILQRTKVMQICLYFMFISIIIFVTHVMCFVISHLGFITPLHVISYLGFMNIHRLN